MLWRDVVHANLRTKEDGNVRVLSLLGIWRSTAGQCAGRGPLAQGVAQGAGCSLEEENLELPLFTFIDDCSDFVAKSDYYNINAKHA